MSGFGFITPHCKLIRDLVWDFCLEITPGNGVWSLMNFVILISESFLGLCTSRKADEIKSL